MITIKDIGISLEDLKIILSFEGCKLTAYKCPAGVWTIGYGTTKNVKAGMVCTLELATQWMLEDLKKVADLVDALKLNICNNARVALIDFVYNLGIGNLKSSTLLKKIKAHSPNIEILNEFRKWVYANGKPLAGLIKRREWEAIKYIQ